MTELYMRTVEGSPYGVPKKVPRVWGNISGFNLLSDAQLKTHGWYPVDVVEPPEYDPDEQYLELEYVLGEDSITPTYTLTDFLDVGRVGQWCSVVDGAITAGPFKCPKVWDGVQMYLLTEEELNAMNWYKYVDEPPEYDEDTQYLSHVNEVALPVVNAVYTVNDYTAEQMAERIANLQKEKITDLYVNIKSFIETQPNGFIRYDADLKMNVMNAAMTAVAAGQPEPEACTAVKTWIFTVQSEFFALKAAIAGAETLADLRDVDVSVGTLESKYGREGTVAADPAVSTDDLFA